MERVNDGAPITFFEITGAAMFLAFSRHPADAMVLEVGLGGKYDATNVVPKPAMTIVQPVGLDHVEFLGNDIATIAGEKAGIIRPGVPVVIGPQDEIAREVILRRADKVSAPPSSSARISLAARSMAAWSMRTRPDCSTCRCRA